MKSDSYVQPLSRPHSLNDPHEMDEVSKRGGLVFKCGKVYRLNG
ncbi:hypothetical protein E6Q11_04255 [Candidatus Dojkabacteria bacterium]|uniref:Uncharacterized protein n=1 Tax=Candidatus Dojkabacteria bacterium TaxID=2099670 RepID=A0A5C7J535_9BACT|nr:MAG: hypothetical protein E6Q11_04255 [Candidatus Dojkabacteria bacterium]